MYGVPLYHTCRQVLGQPPAARLCRAAPPYGTSSHTSNTQPYPMAAGSQHTRRTLALCPTSTVKCIHSPCGRHRQEITSPNTALQISSVTVHVTTAQRAQLPQCQYVAKCCPASNTRETSSRARSCSSKRHVTTSAIQQYQPPAIYAAAPFHIAARLPRSGPNTRPAQPTARESRTLYR